jgi:hypothetical protein
MNDFKVGQAFLLIITNDVGQDKQLWRLKLSDWSFLKR